MRVTVLLLCDNKFLRFNFLTVSLLIAKRNLYQFWKLFYNNSFIEWELSLKSGFLLKNKLLKNILNIKFLKSESNSDTCRQKYELFTRISMNFFK